MTHASAMVEDLTVTDPHEAHARVAWSVITEPGDQHAGMLTQTLGHAAALTAITTEDNDQLEQLVPGISEALPRWRQRGATSAIDRAWSDIRKHHLHLVNPTLIPGMVDLGTRAPHALYARGDLAALDAAHRITITGARAASLQGERQAANLASAAVAAGAAVYAGGAYGIDGAVHRAAIDAGGNTIAWMPGGLDRAYPAGHSALFDRIAGQPRSAVVSEMPPGAAPTRWRYLARARALAAATEATVIVEAGARSGALHLAGHAAALGRAIGAVPGDPSLPQSAGCQWLIDDGGAHPIVDGKDAVALLSH